MFERFTEEARHVVVLAQDEARQTFGHNYIGTEHLLLGLLLGADEIAAGALEALDVRLERVRTELGRRVPRGEEPATGQIPFTPRAKKILELALREALALGHNYIGPEHILLGLTREGEGVAAQILTAFGVDAEALHNQVISRLSGSVARGHRRPVTVLGPPGRPPEPPWLAEVADLLDGLGPEIRREHGRAPDTGDLLLVLATARETIPGRALAELGISLEELAGAVERFRGEKRQEASARLDEVRRRLGLRGPDGPEAGPASPTDPASER